jgi:IS30 family transposase
MKQVELAPETRDVVEILESGDPDTLAEAIARLQQLRIHFQTSYQYVVGDWSGARRAKDTHDGRFVTKEEVIEYLEAERP